ncbi:MAG: hypothetical protein LBU16_06010 [Treponema sp.]|jgi:hypothetical protein|nr:hypothetical protein [Treponema sp.]
MQKVNTAWLKGEFREIGIFLGWIAGMFLIAGFAWSLTRPLRSGSAIRHINAALSELGETRRLEAPLVFDQSLSRRKAAKAAQLGNWYALSNSEDRGVVFSIMVEGILAPFLVFISPQGEAGQLIPLGVHSVMIMDRLPQGTLQTYISRFEGGGK